MTLQNTPPSFGSRPRCRQTRLGAVVGLTIILGLPGAAPRAGGAPTLPPNEWVRLEGASEPGRPYSAIVFAPSRGQALHWGWAGHNRPPRSDVAALDWEAGRWTPDDPTASPEQLRESAVGPAVTHSGRGAFIETLGVPKPAAIVQGVTWDSRRGRLVFAMKGLTAAYDPQQRRWTDLEARTVWDGWYADWPDLPVGMYERGLRPEQKLAGAELPGGPPVYGASICYDPVNDEILLFGHWGGQNADFRDATGRVSAHAGTMVFRPSDARWRRLGESLGTPEVRRSRRELLAQMSQLSDLLDRAWALRERADDAPWQRVAAGLEQLHDWSVRFEFTGAAVGLPKRASGTAGQAGNGTRRALLAAEPGQSPTDSKLLAEAVAAARRADRLAVVRGGGEVLRLWEDVLRGPLAVEPPPRAGGAMAYDPGRRVIVLFGGQDGLVRTDLASFGRDPEPGSLDDTWLYDVAARQWREVASPRRPPSQRIAMLAHHGPSGEMLLLTRGRLESGGPAAMLWSLDEGNEWRLRHEAPWPGDNEFWFSAALDEGRNVLLLRQGDETYAMRLSPEDWSDEPAPEREPSPPLKPHCPPPDDPAWVEKLRSLPANRWIHPRPPRDADTRDWGVAACDPVRGWVVYFGGGHSTYQVDDVAIYAVGANRWSHAAGEHNDWFPPIRWDGCAMGMRGGPPAGHQRNTYVAYDGRVYVFAGAGSRRWDAEPARWPGRRHTWFYDVDRGGVWRQQPITDVQLGPSVPGAYGRPHVVDPRGMIYGFGGQPEPYDGRFFHGESYFSAYDVGADRLTIRRIPGEAAGPVGEGRPFCMLTDRNQVFYYEKHEDRHRTWVYDIGENRFIDLKPARLPPADPRTVEYVAEQKAVLAIVGQGEPWVYSLERNTWAPLPLESDEEIGFARPYGQMVYVARYGVMVNTGSASRGVAVMRPDLRRLRWD
jgi:hypothetical protein